MAVENDFRLIVQNIFRRHFAVEDSKRQPGAAPDGQAQTSVDGPGWSRARLLCDQDALTHLSVWTCLRQSTPCAIRKVDLFAGNGLFRNGGFGFVSKNGSHANGRADCDHLKPGFCGPHCAAPAFAPMPDVNYSPALCVLENESAALTLVNEQAEAAE
jgi:hypothetical protein